MSCTSQHHRCRRRPSEREFYVVKLQLTAVLLSRRQTKIAWYTYIYYIKKRERESSREAPKQIKSAWLCVRILLTVSNNRGERVGAAWWWGETSCNDANSVQKLSVHSSFFLWKFFCVGSLFPFLYSVEPNLFFLYIVFGTNQRMYFGYTLLTLCFQNYVRSNCDVFSVFKSFLNIF